MILQACDSLSYFPTRIVSLVPSQTELLFFLGAADNIIAITKFCTHPKQARLTKNIIGGPKNININKINALQPDLIIANKEENIKEQVEVLAGKFPVWLTEVTNLTTALQMINDVSKLTNTYTTGHDLINNIKTSFATITPHRTINVAYLIWQHPYMTVGADTFINDMLCQCGFQNIFADQKRYPIITIDQLEKANCNFLLLSSEPYPFKQKHLDALQIQLPNTKIVLVDGEMFSWYGSRLLYSAAYFKELLITSCS